MGGFAEDGEGGGDLKNIRLNSLFFFFFLKIIETNFFIPSFSIDFVNVGSMFR